MTRLRELCTKHGALLVFDEVMTGFRVALGGAQSVYAKLIPGFKPDMSVFGKVIGGGMPLAAFGASKDVMSQLAPLGPVYQAGTLQRQPGGHRLRPGHAEARSPSPASSRRCRPRRKQLVDGLTGAAQATPACRWSATAKAACSASSSPTRCRRTTASVMATDKERFNRFFHAMLDRGVYLAPALYEAGFVSAAHSDADIAATVAAARRGAARLNSGRRRAQAVDLCRRANRYSARSTASPFSPVKVKPSTPTRVADLDLGHLPGLHARQRRQLDLPAPVLARRQLRGLAAAPRRRRRPTAPAACGWPGRPAASGRPAAPASARHAGCARPPWWPCLPARSAGPGRSCSSRGGRGRPAARPARRR